MALLVGWGVDDRTYRTKDGGLLLEGVSSGALECRTQGGVRSGNLIEAFIVLLPDFTALYVKHGSSFIVGAEECTKFTCRCVICWKIPRKEFIVTPIDDAPILLFLLPCCISVQIIGSEEAITLSFI